MEFEIISVDFFADFGFFKKPDVNDTIFLTYNFIHKPAILGILGAILGLSGHTKEGELPEYYQELKDIKIGIQPIGKSQENGNFEKIIVKYNDSTGFSNQSDRNGATLNVKEQILVRPSYRIYFKLEKNHKYSDELKKRLGGGKGVFVPYFGKNEFHCWWKKSDENSDSFDKYDVRGVKSGEFKISTIFSKPEEKTLKDLKKIIAFSLTAGLKETYSKTFAIFERLPIGFDETLKQYSELQEFIYTNLIFEKSKFPDTNDFYEVKLENSSVEEWNVIYML